MRIFVGIDIDEEIRQRIHEFTQQMRESAPAARWVKPETFHITLKFLGEAPPEKVENVKKALAAVKGPPVGIRCWCRNLVRPGPCKRRQIIANCWALACGRCP